MTETELYYFKMATCPYCRRASAYLGELRAENPDYAAIRIREIDENVEKKLAESYDYYFVPCFFLGDEKLHEGAATKEDVRRVLDAVLARANEPAKTQK